MKSKLILGTVQFGLDYGINNNLGKPSDNEMKSILDFAYSQGVSFLDTAEAYGDAQQRIGNYHSGVKHRFNLITKYSSQIDLPVSIGKRVEYNLSTLKVDRLYSYMFHSFDEYKLYYSEFRESLRSMVNGGLIEKLGVSVYTNEEAMQVLDDDSIRLIQLPFNLLDNINKRKQVLQKAKERGVEIHTRSVFLQGLFFKQLSQLSDSLHNIEPYLKQIRQVQYESNFSMQAVALNYVLHQELISKVLIGVDSLLQLQENIESSNLQIDESTIRKIDEIDVKEIELLNPVNWK